MSVSQVTAADELAQGVDAVQQAVSNIERFGKSEWVLLQEAVIGVFGGNWHSALALHRGRPISLASLHVLLRDTTPMPAAPLPLWLQA